jgi:predicted DNA-binding transcriptional regulator AlpA
MSHSPETTALRERLLPWRQVREMTGLSRTTAWRLQKRGDFPAPLVISPGRVGWRERDLEAWTESRGPRGAGGAPPRPPPKAPAPPRAPEPAAAVATPPTAGEVGRPSAQIARRPRSKRRPGAPSLDQLSLNF